MEGIHFLTHIFNKLKISVIGKPHRDSNFERWVISESLTIYLMKINLIKSRFEEKVNSVSTNNSLKTIGGWTQISVFAVCDNFSTPPPPHHHYQTRYDEFTVFVMFKIKAKSDFISSSTEKGKAKDEKHIITVVQRNPIQSIFSRLTEWVAYP